MSLKEELAKWLWIQSDSFGLYDELARGRFEGKATQLIKELRLVQLDEDQSLPEPSVKVRGNYNVGYNTAKLDMLKKKFRKIKES